MNKQLASYLFAGETIFMTNQTMGVPTVAPIAKTAISTPEAPIVASKQNKSLLIIVNGLSETQKDLLSKILGSVKKTLQEADILDISTLENPSLANFTSAKEVISFGVGMSKFKIEMLLFPYQAKTNNTTKYLIVDDLSTIQLNQKDEKRLLWAALKSMFEV